MEAGGLVVVVVLEVLVSVAVPLDGTIVPGGDMLPEVSELPRLEELPDVPLVPLEPDEGGATGTGGVVVVVVVDSAPERLFDGVTVVVVDDDGEVALLPAVPGMPEVVSVEAVRLQAPSATLARISATIIFNR